MRLWIQNLEETCDIPEKVENMVLSVSQGKKTWLQSFPETKKKKSNILCNLYSTLDYHLPKVNQVDLNDLKCNANMYVHANYFSVA